MTVALVFRKLLEQYRDQALLRFFVPA